MAKVYAIIIVVVGYMENLELIFQSENIFYVKMNEYLLKEYLKIVV